MLAPKLARLARDHPDVVVDLTTTEESRVDLVGAGFDAGIHLGEFIERDMVEWNGGEVGGCAEVYSAAF